MSQLDAEAIQLRAVIQEFLQARLQSKLDKEKDEDKCQKLTEAFQFDVWIADAAKRVGQIQQITHALKYIHPDAKGTNINSPGNSNVEDHWIGTHTIASSYSPDVVGNAAALDVYKFLRLEVNEKSLLFRAMENDGSLQRALSSDAEQANEWITAFAGLTQSKGELASNKLAKQLYWPVDGGYHLIAPLFPTSLVHYVWGKMRGDRSVMFEILDSKKTKSPLMANYCVYPNITIQRYGGDSGKQNISQMNAERGGENHLLPSCPPSWKSESVKPPFGVTSVFDGWFGRRLRVRALVKELNRFLYRVQYKNNIDERNQRAELVSQLVDEAILFAAELHELEVLWSQDEKCRLNLDEQCWLNPQRVESDKEFSHAFTQGDWVDGVCQRFSNWLNGRLTRRKKSLPFGEDEALEWQAEIDKVLAHELRALRDEQGYDIPIHMGAKERQKKKREAAVHE